MGTGPSAISFSAGKYTWSVYLKAAELTFAQFTFNTNVTTEYANFNLSTGVVTAGTYDSAGISAVGNGWYRCSVTFTAAAVTGRPCIYLISSGTAAAGAQIVGNGTNGLLAWGAQLEAGSFATSYIPTGSATATRNADVASVGTNQFPYSASESTIVAAVSILGRSTGNAIVELSASGSANGLLLYQMSGVFDLSAYVDSTNVSIGTATANTLQKLGLAYNGVSNGAVRNGGTVVSVGTTVSAPANKLGIGSGFAGTFQFNGYIRQITYLPRRITNAELQTRTA
jgi:hypothetical protein